MGKTKISLKAKKDDISVDKYAGEWVAFANGKIVAHGESLRRLMKRVKKLRGKEKPSVMLVPRKSERNYII